MLDCLFCKIIDRKIPAEIVSETEEILAFKDIQPVSPSHILIIPKKHICSLYEAETDDKQILGQILLQAGIIAKQLGLENGFRLVCNSREDSGQIVQHLHFHLLGGRKLGWPPG